MPLPILLLTRPDRVARLVMLSGLSALLAAALARGPHPLAPAAATVALLATVIVLGVLAPLYGRAAAIALWTARCGVAVGAVALLLPEGRPATAARVAATLIVLGSLRIVARGVRRIGGLPVWSCSAVGAGVAAALLAPNLGGGLVLGLAWLAVAAAIYATYVAPDATPPPGTLLLGVPDTVRPTL